MYDIQGLKERIIIIKNSDIDDATILNENYKHLIKNTVNPDEQKQFVILHMATKKRINRLKDTE